MTEKHYDWDNLKAIDAIGLYFDGLFTYDETIESVVKACGKVIQRSEAEIHERLKKLGNDPEKPPIGEFLEAVYDTDFAIEMLIKEEGE